MPFARHSINATFQLRDIHLRDISTARYPFARRFNCTIPICATFHFRDILLSSCLDTRLISLGYVKSGYARLGYIRYSRDLVRSELVR